MKYYLGIDGGGTKTKLILIDEDKRVVFENTSGPSSIDTVPLYVTYQNIYEGFKIFSDKNDITISAIFAGLGGIVFEEDKEKVKDVLKQLPCVTNDTIILVENDMYNALYSGLLFDEGMCLICGTGMVAFGLDKKGNRHKAGGWGFKEGELGSGYHLGMEAIRHMIRCFDGRLPKDDFAKEVALNINLKVSSDIIPIMDDLHNNRTKVASLAPIVTKYANASNEAALHIINVATTELVLSIRAVFNKLMLPNPKLVIVGSLGNVDGRFKQLLHDKIYKLNHHIEILKPIVDPALAAALYAHQKSKR